MSAAEVRAFIERIKPNMEGVPARNIFNYDESPFRDDPSTEDAFFAAGTRHCEKVQNHSKTAFSVMFCCRYGKNSSQCTKSMLLVFLNWCINSSPI